jgi:hypothetical protein
MRNKRRTTTRKRVMYGGQLPPLIPAPAGLFPGDNFNPQDVYNALNNYLQAAWSINEAAKAIDETSQFQNNLSSDPNVTGTRVLQKSSAVSFSTATSSFINSLRGIYGSLTSGLVMPLPPVPIADTPAAASIPMAPAPV